MITVENNGRHVSFDSNFAALRYIVNSLSIYSEFTVSYPITGYFSFSKTAIAPAVSQEERKLKVTQVIGNNTIDEFELQLNEIVSRILRVLRLADTVATLVVQEGDDKLVLIIRDGVVLVI
jgi:hypothetical protein